MSVLEQVKFEAVPVPNRPAPWQDKRDNLHRSSWDCTITYGGESMVVPFWMGEAHTAPPTATDVLECLTSDIYFADDIEEFDAVNDGVPFSQARKTWDALQKNAADMRRVFGDDLDELEEEVRDR